MLRLKEIQDAFAHLCGWKPGIWSDSGGEPELITDMNISESGLFYQDAHPLLTLENIKAAMPEDYYLHYEKYNPQEVYHLGDKVRNGREPDIYIGLVENIPAGTVPGTDDAYWRKWNPLNDFLTDLVNAGISDVVTNFIQEKKLSQETRDLLEHRTFFTGAAKIQATIENKDRLVGFELTPMRAPGVTMRIDRIGFQSIGGSGRMSFYLFHSSQQNPVRVIPMTFTLPSRGQFQWLVPDKPLYLPYSGGVTDEGMDLDSGGSWYLCYDQRDLPPRTWALNMTKDWSKEPCGTCGVENIVAWRELTKYLQISPFFTQGFDGEPGEFIPAKPDPSSLIYTTTQNFGLNCEVSIGCDLTDFIIQQKSLFSRVLQKQVCCNVLRLIALNPDVRVNRNQANVGRMDILYELDGNPQGRATGLNQELKAAYKALSFDTKGLSKACLACNTKGVRFRVA